MARAAAAGGGRKTAAPRKPKITKPGIEIDGTYYPFPDDYTLAETEGICEIWGVENMLQIDPRKEVLTNPTHVRTLCWVVLRRAARAGKLVCRVCNGKPETNQDKPPCSNCWGEGLQRDYSIEESGDIMWERVSPVWPDAMLRELQKEADAASPPVGTAEAKDQAEVKGTISPPPSSATSSRRTSTK